MIEKRNWLTVMLLSIVTCGIYGIIFFCKYADDVNKVCEGDGKTTKGYIVALLLGIITCGIYQFVWLYGIGGRLEEAGKRYDVKCQSPIVYLLICFVPIYSFYYLCENMNQFADKVNA
ncbi:MAG: DUF4234 domain-containing protein [Oscillospiraceae bacterium]|nr:DUF4234 domain-containing protein [Oscillospiraceae bacterium]MBQ9938020.1 DUF4234 domain-containing protein [Oscillospiraceae bacterium]